MASSKSVYPFGFIKRLYLPFLMVLNLLLGISLNVFSQANQPELSGPNQLCIVFGGVIGTFSGGGNPNTDIYSWLVTSETGETLFNRTGGDQFDEIKVSFNEIGNYTVSLSVRRGTENIYESTLEVSVTRGPKIDLLPDYLLCGDEPVELVAIDENTPNFSEYYFVWKDYDGNIVGNQNRFYTREEGFYFVELFLSGSGGSRTCLISGSTFVGPSLDFEVLTSAETICQGQSVFLTTDTPISGKWLLKRPGTDSKVEIGDAFSLNIEAGDLQDIGVYEASFVAVDPDYPDCPSERKVRFEVVEAPKIDVLKISEPKDCADDTGSFSVTPPSNLDSLIIPEINFSNVNLGSGSEILFENLKPQVYTISAYRNGCEYTSLMILESEDPPSSSNPPVQMEVNYSVGAESCSDFSVRNGWIDLDFPDGEVDGEYRILALGKGTIRGGNISDQDTLRVDLPDGNYLFELKIDGCTYPIQELSIENQPEVEFSIPPSINICETFDFIPETDQDLTFTLYYPDGQVESKSSQNSFNLTQAGSYRLEASPRGGENLCSKFKTFTATLSQRIEFDAVLIEEDCFGNKVYEAQLVSIDESEASIRWLNEDAEIVGRGALFYPTSVGAFSLIVQPLESGFCPVEPENFEIEPPIFEVPVDLSATKFCPNPDFATITLETNEEEVTRVDWIYYDESNDRQELDQLADQFEIQVFEIGAYEAVVFNKLGCEIGRNFIFVEESTLLDQPEIADRVPACSKENSIPPLDPGEYETYEWFFEGSLVSSKRLFKPTQVGSHTLVVTTVDGCEFVKEFETFEVCNFNVVHPNAMVLGDSTRDFRLLVDEGVDEVELFVLNRQGALIHYDFANQFEPRSALFKWDGKVQGKQIPLGTYVVVIQVRNTTYGFEDKITSSLLVIQ
ncbi:hypothetical protein [Algoriphagus sediminis]|uniref:Gliding motility-associated C-terminal domain-containing protein n=1 Tax=Algoriphagus sediminis TaxID=3057113 RepID=A0ABT7Y922_9BACT|nr:hypothetical protein [Algoriphagus sediminis]MDN3203017.1 hypothetical protein [Algoriphagus sediminis]